MVDLSSANSFEEIIEILKKTMIKMIGDWLIGYGWDQSQWKDKNWPNNELLNKNFNNMNVVLNNDGHAHNGEWKQHMHTAESSHRHCGQWRRY